MNTLDCETPKSTEESLCRLLGLSYNRLLRCVEELAKLQFEVNTDIIDDRWLRMLRYAVGYDFQDVMEGSTCWFHATRTHDTNSFLAGISCLQDRLEPTWSL